MGTQTVRVSSCTVQIRERRKQYCNKHKTGVQHLISQVALFKADNIANENVAKFKRGCKKLVFQVTLFKIGSVTNKNVTIEWLEKTKRHCKDVIHRADNSRLAIHCNLSLFYHLLYWNSRNLITGVDFSFDSSITFHD